MNKKKILIGSKFLYRRIANTFLKSPKIVGLVVSSFDKGGLEQVVLNLYKQYNKDGFKTYILVQNNEIGDLADYIDDPHDLFVFNDDWELFYKICYKKRINILHYHYNIFGLNHVKHLGFKTIYTIHNVYTWLNDNEMKERFDFIKNADHIVAVSSFVKDYFVRRNNIPSNLVDVVVNGIDFKELDGVKSSITRESLGIEANDVLFVNIASFHRNKHQLLLVEAMKILNRKHNNIKLLLIGNIGDKNYYDEIKNSISNNKLEHCIFNLGYIPRKEIGDFLKNTAQVMVLPSLQEGCSNAVLESMYCGLPMILTDVGNAADMKYSAELFIIPAAFDDIMKLSLSETEKLSKNGKTKNLESLVKIMEEVACNIKTHRKNAADKKHFAYNFSSHEMASQYERLF